MKFLSSRLQNRVVYRLESPHQDLKSEQPFVRVFDSLPLFTKNTADQRLLLRVRVVPDDDDRLFEVDEDRIVETELDRDEDPERTVADLFAVFVTLHSRPEDRVFQEELPATSRI